MVALVEQFAPKQGAVDPKKPPTPKATAGQDRAPDFFGRPAGRALDPVTQVLDRAGESSGAATIACRGAALAQGEQGDIPLQVSMKLPGSPKDLPPEWEHDPTHRHPNGERYRHPGGRYLDWHPGQEGKPGWRGKDHWHDTGGREHLPPGSEIPDPTPEAPNPMVPLPPDPQRNQKIGVWVGTGLVVGGVGLIVFDVVTIPSGEGLIGVAMIGSVFSN